MTEVIETANYVSQQTDRWLFVALLVIGLMAIGILFRYFTGPDFQLRSIQHFTPYTKKPSAKDWVCHNEPTLDDKALTPENIQTRCQTF